MGLFLGSEILAVQNSGMSFYLSLTSACIGAGENKEFWSIQRENIMDLGNGRVLMRIAITLLSKGLSSLNGLAMKRQTSLNGKLRTA